MRETVEDRNAHMRKVNRRDQEWAESKFRTKGYIYYKRIGNFVECMCGACGNKYAGIAKASPDPFEALSQHTIKAGHNKEAICERCGYVTKYKAAGKIRSKFINEKYTYTIGQRMGKEEFVFRVFNVEQVMYADRKTEYDHQEYIRVFLRPGKKEQKDYFIHDYWTGTDHWIDHNLGGLSNIAIPWNPEKSPNTWKEIQKTPMFKYVPKPEEDVCAIRYYIAAARYPDFEMIIKSGMEYLAIGLIYRTGTGYRSRGKTYYNRLGIQKDRVKDLIKKKGDTDVLKAYQIEKRAGKHWNDKEIEEVINRILTASKDDIIILSEVYKTFSPLKVKQYIEKTIQNEGCGAYVEYIDYLRMRKDAGYDLTNEIILFPKELYRKHNEMVLETEEKKAENRKKEVIKKYPKIAERYAKLSEQYSATAAGYIIRPAKNAAEIVEEGRTLHHCVGGDHYLSSHNNGSSTILFLRCAKEPDTPFITVQIKGEMIQQWYGAYDKKPQELSLIHI